MPKLETFAIAGLDIRIHSNDHLPPRVHVTRRGQWSIKVFFLETTEAHVAFDIVFGRRIPRAIRARFARAVAEHRAALLREWESKVQGSCSR